MDYFDYEYDWSVAVARALAVNLAKTAYHEAVADKALRDARAATHAQAYVPALEAIFEWDEDDMAMVVEMNVDVQVFAAQNELDLSTGSMPPGNILDLDEVAEREEEDENMSPIPDRILLNGFIPEMIEAFHAEQFDNEAELKAVIDNDTQYQPDEQTTGHKSFNVNSVTHRTTDELEGEELNRTQASPNIQD